MTTLTFDALREANVRRCNSSVFGGTKDETHLQDWTPTDWACAVAGEVGEACNLIKKLRRGDNIPIEEVAKELADVTCYLDLLAARLGIDLGAAVVAKFNEVSARVGSPIRLPDPPSSTPSSETSGPVHTDNCSLKHVEMSYCIDCAAERANERLKAGETSGTGEREP